MTKNRLYTFTMLTTMAGFVWLCLNYNSYNMLGLHSSTDICFFKRATGLPCPSCGTTRSIEALLHLQFSDALHYNPLGFIMALALFVIPVWIVSDMLSSKNSFHSFYLRTEKVLQSRLPMALLILLVLVNWVWNIYKYAS